MGDGIAARHIGRLFIALIALAIFAGGGIVRADDTAPQAGLLETASPQVTPVAETGPAVPQTAFRPNVNCTCRFAGQDFLIGESACIRGALATCSTFLNNTSWSISTAPCPMARLSPKVRSAS